MISKLDKQKKLDQINLWKTSGLEDYNKIFSHILELKPIVDEFFDNVMVMVEDEKIKNNRIALLAEVAAVFGQFADFSRISA